MLLCLMVNLERNIPAVLRLLVLLPKTIVFKLRACTVAAAQQAHMSYRRSAASHATGSMALP
jgi:hypothetical protein